VKSGRIAKLGHQLRTFPETSLNPNNIIALRHQRNDFHTAHTAAIELLEITIKTFKTAQIRNEVIDPISQITTVFTTPITTSPD